MTAFRALIVRDLRLGIRVGGEALTLLLFFIAIGAVVPFAVGPDRVLLARLAPGIIWIAALLSMLLGLDRLFRGDHEDGSLILFRHAAIPLSAIVFAKLAAHWLLAALPLIIATPILALLLAMDAPAFGRTLVSLLAGTPALAAFCIFGAAVTVTLRRGGLVGPVLILPLSVPVLIFGVGAANGDPGSPLLLLVSLSLVAVAFLPFAAALALRQGEE